MTEVKKAENLNPEAQTESRQKLKQQQSELNTHLKNTQSQKSLATNKDQPEQKLRQINQALKEEGEVDPAFRLNEKYRKGSQNPQGS